MEVKLVTRGKSPGSSSPRRCSVLHSFISGSLGTDPTTRQQRAHGTCFAKEKESTRGAERDLGLGRRGLLDHRRVVV